MKLCYHLLLKNIFYLFSFIQEKKLYKNINEITNERYYMKDCDLKKTEKRINQFGVTMTKKH
jgi:hypothetical protein